MNTSVKFDKTKYKGVWKPNTYYDETDMVFYNDALWLADVAFTSGATFDELNWTCPECSGPVELGGWDESSADPKIIVNGNVISHTPGAPLSPVYVFGITPKNPAGNHYFEYYLSLSAGGSSGGSNVGLTWSNRSLAYPNLESDPDTLIIKTNGELYVGGVLIGDFSNSVGVNESYGVCIKNNKLYYSHISQFGVATFNNGQDPANELNPVYTIPSSNNIRIVGGIQNATDLTLRAVSSNITNGPYGCIPWED